MTIRTTIITKITAAATEDPITANIIGVKYLFPATPQCARKFEQTPENNNG